MPAIIYITPLERTPDAKSLKPSIKQDAILTGKDFINMTFCHITEWLSQCIKHVGSDSMQASSSVSEIMTQLQDNINSIINTDTETGKLLNLIGKQISEKHSVLESECTQKYKTFPLKKGKLDKASDKELEFALRIKCEKNNIVKLLIICGIRQGGDVDYSNPGIYISEHYELFLLFLNETFEQTGMINNSRRTWARYVDSVDRTDNTDDEAFAKMCCDRVTVLLGWLKTPLIRKDASM